MSSIRSWALRLMVLGAILTAGNPIHATPVPAALATPSASDPVAANFAADRCNGSGRFISERGATCFQVAQTS